MIAILKHALNNDTLHFCTQAEINICRCFSCFVYGSSVVDSGLWLADIMSGNMLIIRVNEIYVMCSSLHHEFHLVYLTRKKMV